MILTDEIRHLFDVVRTMLGAPIRSIQLSDEQLCHILEIAIGDYTEKIQNWSIMTNWLNMQGKTQFQFENALDYAYGMTIKSLEFSRDYSYWFSREVGLQQRGPYELKKDFFQVERGKQVYIVPAGREINKVLYLTPSTTKAALYGTMGTLDTGIGGGFAQFGNSLNGMGVVNYYIGNTYDVSLLAADLKYKNSMLRGDLAYRVTAGPEGTHLIHLMSVPGSPNSLGGIAADDTWGWNKFAGCYVWYEYYDTGTNADDQERCRLENADKVIITPDQVPLSQMKYEFMNDPTKQIIRQLLVAEAKIVLGNIRGTFSGELKIPQAEAKMDYTMFIEQGKSEKERVLNDLKERLEMMTPWKQMENFATMSEHLNKNLRYKPLGLFVR